MEETATVEQAEPQGSAAPGVPSGADLGSPPPSPSPSGPRPSGQDLMRRGLEARDATRSAARAARETSAADEQPAPDASGETPGTSETGTDQSSDQPRLSRSQRKALKAAESPPAATSPAPAVADTSASAQVDTDPIARVERVERTLTEGLARLETLITKPTPAQADPSQDGDSEAYRQRFGDDTEFNRRAEIQLAGAPRGQWLDPTESDELAMWAINRETRDVTSRQYLARQSELAFQAAEAHGIDQQALVSASSMRGIYDAFVERGRAIERETASAELAQSKAEQERLKGINQQLADQIEAYEMRLPGLARTLVGGGMSGASRVAAIADRARMDGKSQIRAAIAAGPSQRRPGNRGAR